MVAPYVGLVRGEKLVHRLIRRLPGVARKVFQPGVPAVLAAGGDVRWYIRLMEPWLQRRAFGAILDVGANIGQFSLAARAAFPAAELHCFEPIPECFCELQRRLGGRPRVHLHNVAVADRAGALLMRRSEFSPSSSLLSMDAVHVSEFPFTAGFSDVEVGTETLDGALAGCVLPRPVLMKIDVQGAEKLVFAAGARTLSVTDVLVVETSFEPLYRDQPLFAEVLDILRTEGFRFAGVMGQLRSPLDSRALQADSLFLRA